MALTTNDWRILSANPALCKFLGYSEQDLLGRTLQQVTHPDDAQSSTRELHRAPSHSRHIARSEKRYLHKSGGFVWGRETVRTIRGKRGKVECHIAIVEDIKDQKRAQSALQQSEALFSTMFRVSPIGMYVSRQVDGLIIDVNDAFARITGYSAKSAVGHTSLDLRLWARPRDRDQVLGLMRDQGRIDGVEVQLRRKTGDFACSLVSARPFDLAGEACILGTLTDITELKRAEESLHVSEERFRIALAGTPTTVFCQDRRLRYIWAYNPAPEFEIERFLGKRDGDLFEPRDARAFSAIKRQVLRTGVGRRDEVETHFDGYTRIHDMTTEPLRDKRSRIVGVMCAAFDITERKHTEEALKQAHDNLEQKVRDRTAELRKLAAQLVNAEQGERERIAHILHEDVQTDDDRSAVDARRGAAAAAHGQLEECLGRHQPCSGGGD